ncbi:MAG: archease [Acidimicrobiia bacterium]|nr:archease [Acidimicrobiia bacterium]
MSVDVGGSWSALVDGHPIAFEFHGPTLEASLAGAVEGFADAVADVHPSLVAQEHPVELVGTTPAALLLAVLEECLRRGREGEVAIALVPGRLRGEVLPAVVRTVPCDDPHVEARLHPVVSWHEVSLDPVVDGWRGRVVAR